AAGVRGGASLRAAGQPGPGAEAGAVPPPAVAVGLRGRGGEAGGGGGRDVPALWGRAAGAGRGGAAGGAGAGGHGRGGGHLVREVEVSWGGGAGLRRACGVRALAGSLGCGRAGAGSWGKAPAGGARREVGARLGKVVATAGGGG